MKKGFKTQTRYSENFNTEETELQFLDTTGAQEKLIFVCLLVHLKLAYRAHNLHHSGSDPKVYLSVSTFSQTSAYFIRHSNILCLVIIQLNKHCFCLKSRWINCFMNGELNDTLNSALSIFNNQSNRFTSQYRLTGVCNVYKILDTE